MKFKIHIDGAEHEVEADATGMVRLGGETFEAKVTRPSDERRTVQMGEKSYEIRVVENCADTGILILEIAGERIPVTVTDVAKATAVAGGAGTSAAGGATTGARSGGVDNPPAALADVNEGIWAPMPGKIVDVLVKIGDAVDEGAAVVILEAMKMENELHASKKGTVAAVLVKKGDQAEKGQLLVAFE